MENKFLGAEVIVIGDELLIGQTIDTNSGWIGEQLGLIGIPLIRCTKIRDRRDDILKAIESAMTTFDVVIVTGGLGPTKDDITKSTLCDFFNTKLIFDETVFLQVKSVFERRKVVMPALNRNQAMVPETAKALVNSWGTAPGLWFEKNGKILVSLAGIPFEMKNIMKDSVLPELKKRFSNSSIHHQTIIITGIGESALSERIEEWENALPKEMKLAYLPSLDMVRLRITAEGVDAKKLKKETEIQFEKLKKIVPEYYLGSGEESFESVLGELLLAKKWTLGIAESCSGGSIARMITRIPGCSAYFNGSVVAYSYEAKEKILGVRESTLAEHGAVSEATVLEMALGAKKIFNSDCAIATSGIAGPSGATKGKPVGTVWIAISTPQRTIAQHFIFGKGRGGNIQQSSAAALNLLRKELLSL